VGSSFESHCGHIPRLPHDSGTDHYQGATLNDFKNAVSRFYNDTEAGKAVEDSQIDTYLISNADRQLQEKAWTWLLVHSDIWVGRAGGEDNATPDILVAADQDASVLSLTEAEITDLHTNNESKCIRLWTSHERVWQTVAGHGVDFKRIPGEEFRLLCLIAGAGPEGIAQPSLVKMSKQDKKSVPGRTDNLHKGGYIRKTKILAEKHNTSLLVHRRFLPEEELDALSRPVFVNGSLSFENLLGVLKEKLKNGASMKMEDLEELLGCVVKSWEKRALWRALERLDIIGVIQRFRLDELKEGKRGKMRNFKTKYIKLLHDPTDADFKRYTSLTVKDREDFRRRLEAQDAETKGEHAEYMDDDDLDPEIARTAAIAKTTDEVASIMRNMNWDSDVAWTNTIFNAVEGAGVKGLSSMSSRESTYGRFYDRPVEQMLARLTDVWQKAQPDNLKDFSVIRDTDTKGRSTNYVYRTHDSFQQAVDQDNTVWENATGGKAYQKPIPQLDDFGFSRPDTSQFLNHGTATLIESIANAEVAPEIIQKSDPVLRRNPDGTLKVVWKHNQASKKPRKDRASLIVQENDDDGLPVISKERRALKAKGTFSTGRKNVVAENSTTENPTQPTKGKTQMTDIEMRIKAEEQAYFEAKDQQISLPLSLPGRQLASTWKPGKGRARMTLVNDVESTGKVDHPTPAPTSRRPPIMVLESRVMAIFESLKLANDHIFAANPDGADGVKKPTVDQQLAVLKSPRLNELAWFRASAAGEGELATTSTVGTAALQTMSDAATAYGTGPGSRPGNLNQVMQNVLHNKPSIPARANSPTLVTRLIRSASVRSSKHAETPQPERDGRDDQEAIVDTLQIAEGEPELQESLARKDWSQRQSTYIRPPPPGGSHRKKKGTVVGRGTAQYKRIKLIEQIMEKSGGIFPGESEMVPAFQKLQKDELKSQTTADRDTIMKAVKALVDDDKLVRFAFFFKDKNDKQVQKWIIHQPNKNPAGEEIKDLMSKIEEAYPKNYVPPPYGDGETGRSEQRKNIDRFQYRPGKSVIQPSGTDFVIDVEAKRKELEAQRLAAAAAIRAEELKRLKAQHARNKKRQAALASKPRKSRASLHKTAQPKLPNLALIDDDPDTVVPSVETDGPPLANIRPGRMRYRNIRPAAPISVADIAKLDSGLPLTMQESVGMQYTISYNHDEGSAYSDAVDNNKQDEPEDFEDDLSLRLQLQKLTKSGTAADRLPRSALAAGNKTSILQKPLAQSNDALLARANNFTSVPIVSTKPGARRRLLVTDRPSKQDAFAFRLQGPQTYDQFYEIQDVTAFLCPLQRFHPNTGTFSTDFFIRTNVRHSHWLAPSTFLFEHHNATNSKDIEWYSKTDDYDNFYHPEKKSRKWPPGLLSKKGQENEEDEEDSAVELEDRWFERKELKIMKEEFPDLIHEPVGDGFANFTFGGIQKIAEEIYQYGLRPMEHIVLHGVEPEDFPGIQFEEHGRRPNMPSALQDELNAEEDDEVEQMSIPRSTQRAKRPRRRTLDQIHEDDDEVPVMALSKERRPGHQSGKCHISSTDSRRLFFACIAVKVLSGELEGTVSWNAIRDVFADHPNFDLPTFKARWNRMWNSYKEIADRVQREFQDAFITAYDQGLLPSLNVMHGSKLYYKSAANWRRVVDWAVKTIPVFPDDVGLPSSRDQLDIAFEFKTGSNEIQDMREKLEHVQSTHSRREDLVHKISFATPFVRKSRSTVSNVDVARSWVRANCATVDDRYDALAANRKLKKLDQSMLMAVTKQLHAEKIIAHSFKLRNKAARNYHLSDQYNQIFNKRPLDAGNFTYALAFKVRLDEVFTSDSPSLLLDYNLSDGAVLAITELLAAGRVIVKPVLPPIDSTIGAPWPRLTVWGFTEGAYKLRNMDRKSFLWSMEVMPTNKYVTGMPTATRVDIIKPPRILDRDKAGSERIPLWYDIHGNLIPKYWEAIVRSVVQHIAMRAGSTIATLTAPYRGLVWEWEMQMLVDWLVEVGVAKYNKNGAVVAKEWWWTVVPKQSEADKDEEHINGVTKGQVNGVDVVLHAPKKRRVRGGKAVGVRRNGL
jgi:hypothetical protein